MTRDVGDFGDRRALRALPLPRSSQIGVDLSDTHPKPSQIGAGFSD
jgi:hypothetical protein